MHCVAGSVICCMNGSFVSIHCEWMRVLLDILHYFSYICDTFEFLTWEFD